MNNFKRQAFKELDKLYKRESKEKEKALLLVLMLCKINENNKDKS